MHCVAQHVLAWSDLYITFSIGAGILLAPFNDLIIDIARVFP